MTALTLALVLMLHSASAVAAPAAEPAARVRALVDRYREHLLAHRPDLAMRWAVEGARPRLEPLSEVTLVRDAAFTAELAHEIDAVPAARLDPENASLHRMLAGRVAEERAQVGELRRDPLAWVRLVRTAIESATAAPKRTPCDRAQAMATLLGSAPELWRGAAIVLREPSTEPALADSLAATRQWMREALPPLALDCRDAVRLGNFVQADSLAVRALETLATFVLADSTFATARVSNGRSPRGAAGR